MTATDITALVGRERELGLIDAQLASVRASDGSALMVSGEPGSGKTSLLSAAQRSASDLAVVSCRGVEWEAELPFSGLHELLRPLLPLLPALPDPQRDALTGALGLTESGDVPALHLYAGALSLLIEATRERPVLVIADDLQWIDSGTTQVLSFIARRMAGERLGLLLATRPGTLLPGLPGEVRRLEPLDEAAIAELAAHRLGRPLPDDAVADLTAASGGNPLAVVESVAHLGDGMWFRGSELDEPLPVGDLIERGFADRLAAVSEETRAGLETVAASVRDDATTIGAALDQLGLGRRPLDEAERTGILDLAGAKVQFSHPLLRSLVHRRTSPETLRRCHAALAAATTTDPGLHAWHVASAATEPDEAIASELDAAASRFAERGGLRASAQAMARAAELTPDADARARRLLRAGRSAQFAGSGNWAGKLFEDALDASHHPPLRAEAHYFQALLSIHLVPGQDNVARLRASADEAELSGDEDLTARVLVTYAYEAMLNGQGDTIRKAFERMERLHGSPALDPLTANEMSDLSAYIALIVGDEPALRTPEPTLIERTAHREEWVIPTLEALTLTEQFDLAGRRHREWISESRSRGNAFLLSVTLGLDGAQRYRLGDWAAARRQLEESIRVAQTTELAAQTAQPRAMLAIVRAGLGDETFRDEMPEIEELGRTYGLGVNIEFTSAALGLSALGAGRGAEAVSHYENVRRWKRAAGQTEPTGSCWPADIVDAHLLAGDLELTRQRLEELRAFATRTGRAWAVAAVARLDAALAGDDAFEALFLEAFERYAPARDPFGEGRAHLAFGQRLRRLRRRVDARTQLTAALELFEQIGARPWADQARRELGASGETLRRGADADPLAFTPQEAQVAELVAGGASNKSVAGTLFLSPKTVETHLSRIYRKLGVSSRTQLAVAMRSASDALDGHASTPR